MVNEIASKKSKIVFSGQGFDEMFFGYSRNLAAYVMHKWGAEYLNEKTNLFKQLPNSIQNFFTGWENFLLPLHNESILNPNLAIYKKLCRCWRRHNHNPSRGN